MKNTSTRTTSQKALRINLDDNKYGTIVEIGAGQEVARAFFRAGAAAGTIAKTMSAYDMRFSDAVYGVQEGGRYVSKSRVRAMMDKEFRLIIDRIKDHRPKNTRYFAYAATVSAKSFNKKNECHAWCGVQIQMYPGAEPCDLIVHVRMLDKTAEEQQECLGILGVNLIYGAYYYGDEPKRIIDSLTDNLAEGRLEIDSIEFEGPYFEDIDNRMINLHLIRSWKTRAIMFNPDGYVSVPAEKLYKKNVLAIRGAFKPVTKLNVDMIEQGLKAFTQKTDVSEQNTVLLAEISINDIRGNDSGVSEKDIIDRVHLLNALGYSVMISDYTRYFSLRAYFRQYTHMQIGIVLGISNMRQVFNEDFYKGVEGGILEGFGKLFPDNTRLFIYPEKDYAGEIIDYKNLRVAENLKYLYLHLVENNFLSGIDCSDKALFDIYSKEVLKAISNGRGAWEKQLPENVSDEIIEHKLFGYK